MKTRITSILIVAAILMIAAADGEAQKLSREVTKIFDQALNVQVGGNGVSDPFDATRVATSATIVQALATLIGGSIADFPLSATSSGLTFDLSTGVPVASATSTGPVYGERAETLGKNKINYGISYTDRNLARVRGIRTEDTRFSFVHRDYAQAGLGDATNEYDYIDVFARMDFDATVIAMYATYGVSDKLDVGIALPIVTVTVQAEPLAVINSTTFPTNGSASYRYGGTTSDPVLTSDLPTVDNSATGIGDVALRGKYHFYNGVGLDMATLAEFRLATGDEEEFLGTGGSSLKLALIASATRGEMSPHVNVAYTFNSADGDRDEVGLVVGYDQRVGERLTLAVDLVTRIEIGAESDERAFPEPVPIGPQVNGEQSVTASIAASNIPNYNNDNVTNVSFGMKYAPSPKILLVGNILLPVNDGGLRSDYITTFGLEFSM